MAVKGLIEKLSLAIHGEQPSVVVEVLSMFTLACLERWGVDTEDYITRLRRDHSEATPPPPTLPRTKTN